MDMTRLEYRWIFLYRYVGAFVSRSKLANSDFPFPFVQSPDESNEENKPVVIKAKGKVADLVALVAEEMESLQID